MRIYDSHIISYNNVKSKNYSAFYAKEACNESELSANISACPKALSDLRQGFAHH
jgi:hypothetical protein